MKKQTKKTLWRGLTSTSAVLMVVSLFGTQCAITYTGTLNSYLGTTTSRIVSTGDPSAEDTNYYTSEFGDYSAENLQKLIQATYDESVLEQEEGSVLLRNNNSALPLSSNSHVTLFGHAVVQPVYAPGGANSGAASTGTYVIDLYQALKDVGFSINDTLYDAYKNSSTSRVASNNLTISGGPNSTGDFNAAPVLGEEPKSFYTAQLQQSWENDYNDVAIVMLAREGGEDCEMMMEDPDGISALALHQDEKDMLAMIRDSGKFSKIVVLLNSVSYDADQDMFTATVTVKNTGSVSGKSVVQLYVQTPYGDYEKQNAVEKSAVQVIGYGKTDELKPGQSEQVTVTMDRYMMASYDYTNAKGYILSAGDYYLALGDNAHDALNNILAAKGASGMVDQDGNTVEGNAAKTYRWNYDTLDTESYRYSVTGEEVTNQFDDCNANYWQEGSVTYLTRQDWNGTFPTKAPAITCTEEMMQILQGELYTKPEDSPSVSDITQGQNNGLTFVSMKDVSFDDTETWDKYLDQMTVEELASQISDMFGTPEVSSVAKPAFSEGDGTASVGANTFPEEYGDTRDVCLYPCSVVAACMWNNDRLTRRGELMAEEALYCKLPLFWTGGGNLHRTPFGGRNGEYFSEDAVLTNLYTTTELTAVQSRGVTPGIKHVAGNDQEFHREGLAVFFNEQAFREQTLRAFEGALSNENTMALMQSFNRLGLVWSSSSKALCTQVLRKEWGFNGQQETDGVAGGAYKSHFATSLSAGTTTYCIDPTGSAASAIVEEIRSNDDGNMLLNLRDAVKRYHYMLSHTNLINGLSMNATVESIMPWWQIALYAIDVVFALLMVGSLFMMFRAKRRSEEKA